MSQTVQSDPDDAALAVMGAADRLALNDFDGSAAEYLKTVYGESPDDHGSTLTPGGYDVESLRASIDPDDTSATRARRQIRAEAADADDDSGPDFDYTDVDASRSGGDRLSGDGQRSRDARAWKALGGRDRLRCEAQEQRPALFVQSEYGIDVDDFDDVGGLAAALSDAAADGGR